MTWDTNAMAKTATPEEKEFAELLGMDACDRGLPETLNPWPLDNDPRNRVLHWRWQLGHAGSGEALFSGGKTPPPK